MCLEGTSYQSTYFVQSQGFSGQPRTALFIGKLMGVAGSRHEWGERSCSKVPHLTASTESPSLNDLWLLLVIIFIVAGNPTVGLANDLVLHPSSPCPVHLFCQSLTL